MTLSKSNFRFLIETVVVLAIVICITLWPQVHTHSVILGVDSIFHFNRFYDTMAQIKTGHYNYFLMNFGFDETGRIVNALYGAVMAYLQGALLLMAGSWFHYEVLSSAMLMVVAFFGMMVIGRQLKFNRLLQLVAATLYATSPAVIVWITAQQFTGWGAALMPYVFAGAFTFFNQKINWKNSLALAIPMAILIQTHILSAIITTIALVPIIIGVLFQKKNTKKSLSYGLLAVIETILLTGNVWGVMLEIMPANTLLTPWPYANMADYTSTFNLSLPNTINFAFTHGIVFWVLITTQLIISILNWKQTSILAKSVVVTIVVFIVVASPIFPWTWVSHHLPALQVLLQFPRRLNVLPELLTPILVGLNYNHVHFKKSFYSIALAISFANLGVAAYLVNTQSMAWNEHTVLSYSHNVTKFANNAAIKKAFNSQNLQAGLTTIKKNSVDYLPTTNSLTPSHPGKSLRFAYPLYWDLVKVDNSHFTKRVTSKGNLLVKFKMKKAKYQILPLVMYRRSSLFLNNHQVPKTKIKFNPLKQPIIHLNKGVNVFRLTYRPTFFTAALSFSTGIFWGLLLFFLLIKQFGNRRILKFSK
ncbi:hypothetical protein [Secundilactobacillus folii]|uniref:Cell division protein n=1 Tax=Secundilactobacillus folii TaxID=2678357 RepID=A0A7X2XUI2_9LACO|nr:hypothetical protein [Secundilactobacillus folii]MTV81834.1 hypothetical protein [Secundilactobacillus folii]